MAKDLIVFTDGACSVNGSWTGGWAYLIYRKGKYRDLIRSGYERNTTNNRMEMIAIINALKDIQGIEQRRKIRYSLKLVSDSRYCIAPFTEWKWMDKWKNNRFEKDKLNYDLWMELFPLVSYYAGRLRFIHIRGHGRNKDDFYNHYNNIVDGRSVWERLKADIVE